MYLTSCNYSSFAGIFADFQSVAIRSLAATDLASFKTILDSHANIKHFKDTVGII